MSPETPRNRIPRASSDFIDSLYFSPPHPKSPTKRLRRSFTLTGVLFFAGEVNTTARAVRSAVTVVFQVFTFNSEYLNCFRFVKVVTSFRGVLKIRKVLEALNIILEGKTKPLRIRAGWQFVKYTKTVIRSTAWFANIISDLGWISPHRVEWARFVDRVHLPFQAISTSIALLNLCKVGLILFELKMYKSDPKLASGYMSDYHIKLTHDLNIPNDYELGRKVRRISLYVQDPNHHRYAQAKEKCDEIIDNLILIAKKRCLAELVNSSVKVLSLTSTILDLTKPLPLLSASLFSLTITALKTTKYIMNRPQIVYTKAS